MLFCAARSARSQVTLRAARVSRRTQRRRTCCLFFVTHEQEEPLERAAVQKATGIWKSRRPARVHATVSYVCVCISATLISPTDAARVRWHALRNTCSCQQSCCCCRALCHDAPSARPVTVQAATKHACCYMVRVPVHMCGRRRHKPQSGMSRATCWMRARGHILRTCV